MCVCVCVCVRVCTCACVCTCEPSGLLHLFNKKCGLYIHEVCIQKYKYHLINVGLHLYLPTC